MQVAKNQRQSRFAVRSTSLIREIGKSVFEKTRYHVTGPRLLIEQGFFHLFPCSDPPERCHREESVIT